jgi:hypothetical protein
MTQRRRPIWSAAITALTLAVVVAGACRGLVDPPLPDGAVRFTPPPVYARWWAMTEACAGRTGRLSSVKWYVVPNAATIESQGQPANGYWSAASNRIVLAGAVQYTGETVRHEMAHALEQRAGHSRELFLRRCAGVVRCRDECMADAGPAPPRDPAAKYVTHEAFDVTIELTPREPLGPGGDGFLALTVTARNRASYPVVIAVNDGSGTGFSYELAGHGELRRGRAPWIDDEATSFAPGESKRQVFDLRIGSGGATGVRLLPGEYSLKGGYGGRVAQIVAPIQ